MPGFYARLIAVVTHFRGDLTDDLFHAMEAIEPQIIDGTVTYEPTQLAKTA